MTPPNTSEAEWAALMRAGLQGDEAAYRKLLEQLAPALRGLARRRLAGTADSEDVAQEVLLAIHLKRHTWKTDQPFKPWLNAIARHKLIDVMRRRGRRGEVPIDGLEDVLPDDTAPAETSQGELSRLIARLDGKQLDVVRGISLDGDSISETATKLGMSEGAVRVTLHRGLRKLASLYRGDAA